MSKVNPNKRAAPKPEADKTRIIFKHVLETIRSLDEISKGKAVLRDVYSVESIQLRRRLKEYCERLLFVSPVEYGRKTEELLWRKAFYDVIQVMKLIRKNGRPSRAVESAYENHLSAAAGFYCHLLFRLQREYKLEIWNSLDFGYQSLGRIGHGRAVPVLNDVSSIHSVDSRARQWAENACQRCLIYLGDLARYQKDFVGDRSWILAQRYYYQAFLLDPDNGMPHNQLGTLAGTRYYGLDAAYHYIRCLGSATKFDGASGNLERIFEKNRKRYQELSKAPSQRHLSIEPQKLKDIRRLCIRFLRLVDILYNDPSSVEPRELQLLCQDMLQDFSLCLFYTASEPRTGAVAAKGAEESLGEEKMAYLEDEVIAKIVILIIIVVHKLQSHGSKQVAAAIAFNLALFSHILNHVRLRLQSSLDKLGQFDPMPSTATTPAPGSDDDRCTPTADLNGGSRAVPLATTVMGDSESSSACKLPISDSSLNESSRARHHKRKLANRRRRRRSNSQGSSEDLSEGEANVSQRTTAALAAMISDEEEEMNYLNKRRHSNGATEADTLSTSSEASACSSSSSSSSDSSSDGIGMLMESQELRPGFLSGTATSEQADESLERSVLALQKSLAASSGPRSLQALLNGSALPLSSSVGGGSSSSGFVGNEDDLQRLSFDLLTRAEASADVSTSGLGSSGNSESLTVFNGPVPKPIRVPPGFDKDDPEIRHVKEINDKLATYVIDTDTNSSIPTESDTAEGESSGDESIIAPPQAGASTSRNEKSFNRMLSVIASEGLMPTIKILCDWLRWQPQIVSTCIQSSPSLWSRMASFLNFLPHEHDLSLCEDLFRLVSVLRHVRLAAECNCCAEKWKQRYSLREDVHLRKLAAVSMAHASIDFEDRLDMTGIEEAAVRVCHLRMFGYHMAASTTSTSSFTYDTQLATFVGPVASTAAPPSIASTGMQGGSSRQLTQAAAPTEAIDNLSRKKQLMRDMAQLRLQAEVSELEDSVKKFAEPSSMGSLPPYVVVDTLALCEHHLLVRQLVASARFIVIVPQAVIDQLDDMKKEAASARDAIRWLEAEFQKGNRHIRAQRAHERMSNQNEQIFLRRKDKETWRALELIDCCKYLIEHHTPSGTAVVDAASTIAVLLVGGDLASMAISLPQAQTTRPVLTTVMQATATAIGMQVQSPTLFSAVANGQGVTVCNIGQFLEKWKQASKTIG